MLPLALSADACSLAPGVERLAVTAEIVLGSRRASRARPASTAAGSARTLASTTTSSTRSSPGAAPPPEPIAEPLELARRAAAALRDARARVGARGLDARARVRVRRRRRASTAARAVAQTEAHGLIEQLMILTNERVAEHCERRGCRRSTASTSSPTRRGSSAWSSKLAALDVPTPPLPKRIESIAPSQAAEIVAEASRLVGRRGRAPRARPGGVYIARAPLAEAGRATATATSATPGSAAPPTPTSPRRSAATRTSSPTARCSPRSGRARPSPSAAEVREAGPLVLGARARGDADRARRRRRLRRVPARARALRGRARTSVRGRGLGRDRGRGLRALRRRARRRLRGLPAGAAAAAASASSSTRPRPRSSAPQRPGGCASATRSTVRVDGDRGAARAGRPRPPAGATGR